MNKGYAVTFAVVLVILIFLLNFVSFLEESSDHVDLSPEGESQENGFMLSIFSLVIGILIVAVVLFFILINNG